MKKSTLITTIAMIVVVVVALSTATYAWFSTATTTSASDTISTTAKSDWIIMGGKATNTTGTDNIVYSSSNSIELEMLDGLYSPNAILTGNPSNASNSATYVPQPFFTAFQDGTGLATTAKAPTTPTIDPLGEGGNVSAANYVRVINTNSENQNLVLTVTVFTDGTTDSDFYAASAFSTYVGWVKAGTGEGLTGHANTEYYYGTVANSTTGSGEDIYYEATRNGTKVSASGIDMTEGKYTGFPIDIHNEGMRAGSATNPRAGYVDASDTSVKIGEELIESGYYYQFKITIAESIPTNNAVNIVFYAWFDGWSLDNTGANSNATVYYEFGKN